MRARPRERESDPHTHLPHPQFLHTQVPYIHLIHLYTSCTSILYEREQHQVRGRERHGTEAERDTEIEENQVRKREIYICT